MHTPAQEAIAQVLFYTGIGSLPAAIGSFVASFHARARWQHLVLLAVGGALLTHFLWYFFVLGISLATKVGEPHYPSWLSLAPIGFGVALVLTFIRNYRWSSEAREALKHFGVVGLGFALLLGGITTLLVNSGLGALLESLLHGPPAADFFSSALLTVVSIILIILCIELGNWSFHRCFPDVRLSASGLTLSTALFLVVVLAFVVPQFGAILSAHADHTHYFFHHGAELLLMLSLPLVRLIFVTAGYFLISRSSLRSTRGT